MEKVEGYKSRTVKCHIKKQSFIPRPQQSKKVSKKNTPCTITLSFAIHKPTKNITVSSQSFFITIQDVNREQDEF